MSQCNGMYKCTPPEEAALCSNLSYPWVQSLHKIGTLSNEDLVWCFPKANSGKQHQNIVFIFSRNWLTAQLFWLVFEVLWSAQYPHQLEILWFLTSLILSKPSMGRNTGRGKVAYSRISPDPAKAGPTLGVVVVELFPIDILCTLTLGVAHMPYHGHKQGKTHI